MKNLWLILGLLVLFSVGCSRDDSARNASELRDPLLRQAHARLREGDRDGALESLDRALHRKPDLAQAHLDAALLYDEYRKDYVRAIYHYRRYLELRSDVEKRGMIEDLIRKSQMALVANLTEQGGVRDQRLRQLQEENARLLNDLRDLRANLAKQRIAASGAAPVAPTSNVPVGDAPRPEAVIPATASAVEGGAPGGAPPAVASDAAEFIVYHVQPRDTLSSIAAKIYQDPRRWREIFEANSDRLPSPERVYVGQTLLIPREP